MSTWHYLQDNTLRVIEVVSAHARIDVLVSAIKLTNAIRSQGAIILVMQAFGLDFDLRW